MKCYLQNDVGISDEKRFERARTTSVQYFRFGTDINVLVLAIKSRYSH